MFHYKARGNHHTKLQGELANDATTLQCHGCGEGLLDIFFKSKDGVCNTTHKALHAITCTRPLNHLGNCGEPCDHMIILGDRRRLQCIFAKDHTRVHGVTIEPEASWRERTATTRADRQLKDQAKSEKRKGKEPATVEDLLSNMPSSSKDAYPRTLKRKDTTEVEEDDDGAGAILPPKKRLKAHDYSYDDEDLSTDDENAD